MTRTNYDGVGRPTAQIDYGYSKELRRTTTTYPGVDETLTTPPVGASPTRVTKDPDGNTTSITRYDGRTPTGTGVTTRYTYTPAGKLATATDNAGNTWTNTYDLDGRRIKATDPDTGTTTWSYDTDDTLLAVTNAKGQQVKYTYDNLGRKTAVTDAAGTPRATWTYDTVRKGYASSSSRIINGKAITTSTDAYDNLGRPTKTTISVPAIDGVVDAPLAGTWSTTYQYNNDGSYKGGTSPAMGPIPSETLWQQYDTRTGLPASLTSTGRQTLVASTTRNPYGQALQYAQGLPNQEIWDTRTYDDATGRLTSLQLDRATNPVFDRKHSYTYDPAGNVTSQRTDTGGPTPGTSTWLETQCYAYDGQQRLTDAWTPNTPDCAPAPNATALNGKSGSYWTTWTFDNAGNRASQTQREPGKPEQKTTYTYPGAGQDHPHFATQVTTDNATTSYAVDELGNTTSRPDPAGGNQKLEWDIDGSLATVTNDHGDTIQQTWTDTDGDRLIRRTPTDTTLYLGDTELTWTKNTGAVTGVRSYDFDGHTVATRTGAGTDTVETVFDDQQGTPTASIRTSDDQLTTRQYTPYGAPRGDQPVWPTTHGFLDATHDDVTGLTHLGAREYDPQRGAFISADPVIDLTNPAQMTGYAYANNTPITQSDPTGEFSLGIIVGAIHTISTVAHAVAHIYRAAKANVPHLLHSRNKRTRAWGRTLKRFFNWTESVATTIRRRIVAHRIRAAISSAVDGARHFLSRLFHREGRTPEPVGPFSLMPMHPGMDGVGDYNLAEKQFRETGELPPTRPATRGEWALVGVTLVLPVVSLGGLELASAGEVAAAEGGGATEVAASSEIRATAAKISRGHAYDKHVLVRKQYPEIHSREQFASRVEDVIRNGESKKLSRGRMAYWKDDSIVFENPNDPDGGTMFKPQDGYSYFKMQE